jgi:hypothetical protein
VNRRATESLAEYQTTRIGLGGRTIFDNLAVKHGEVNFIEREMIRFGFFVSVIGDPNAVCLYCLDDYGNVHTRLPLCKFTDLLLLAIRDHLTQSRHVRRQQLRVRHRFPQRADAAVLE